MAWFRRNRDEAPETADDAAGPVAPEPPLATERADAPAATADPTTADATTAPAPPAPAWMTAAPMPAVVPTIQRVLDRVDARGSTTLGKPAPLALAPLGHAVTPDAPAGLVSAIALPADAAPSSVGQVPLEYVQRAPVGSSPPRPAPPAQLLVPAFQPNRLPGLPVAPQAVQRAPLTPSLTTAPPPPGPPMVLPVGEVIPPSVDTGPAPAAEPSAQAPLLAASASPTVEVPSSAASAPEMAVEMPLAPVQRHADHPGHVDGDEEPAAEVQRAVADAPIPPPAVTPADTPVLADAAPIGAPPLTPDVAAEVVWAPDVPLPLAPVQRHADHADHPGHVEGDEEPAEVQRAVAETGPPTPSAPLIGDAAPLAGVPPSPATTPTPVAPATPDLPLPGAPIQRRVAPRRPVGLGRPIPSVPSGAVEPGSVGPARAVPDAVAPNAPLLGAAPSAPPPPFPLAAVQRAAAADESSEGEDEGSADAVTSGAGEAPALDLVQRAAIDAVPPTAPTAPLVGESPLEGARPDVGPAAASQPAMAPAPELPLVQPAQGGASGTSGLPAGAAASGSTSSATVTGPSITPLPPLAVAPLLGGRPFSTQVQRAASGASSAPAGLVDRSSPEALSPEPGRTYQPLAGIGMWNGAPPPDLAGPAIEAPPSRVAAAVQRATGTDVSNVRIRRDTGPAVQRLSARALTHEGEVHIPAAVGILDSGEGASLATHELVHAGQQSVLGSARPHEHTPGGQALESQARAAEHASLAGLELPTLPLAPPAAPSVQRAPVEGGSSQFSAQQLSTLLGLANNPPAGGTTVQRVEDPPTPPPPPPSAEAPPQAPAAASERQQTPQELEELATKLFPTIRNLFRTELMGFRRRSGTSSDRPLS